MNGKPADDSRQWLSRPPRDGTSHRSARKVVAAEPSGHEAILRNANPQVILLDIGLENGDSLRVARTVIEDRPDARVIVMDLIPAEEDIKEFVSAGVSGFVMKDTTLDKLVHTIRSVVVGIDVLALERHDP